MANYQGLRLGLRRGSLYHPHFTVESLAPGQVSRNSALGPAAQLQAPLTVRRKVQGRSLVGHLSPLHTHSAAKGLEYSRNRKVRVAASRYLLLLFPLP